MVLISGEQGDKTRVLTPSTRGIIYRSWGVTGLQRGRSQVGISWILSRSSPGWPREGVRLFHGHGTLGGL